MAQRCNQPGEFAPRSVFGASRCAAPLVLVALFAGSGAGCRQMWTQYPEPGARVLPLNPSLADVTGAVNNNTGDIISYYTNNASISGPMFPTLQTSIALERPRRFRLKAETAFTGPEADLGSNDELFWFWMRRSPPPALYFCRHDQFAASAARRVLPVEPDWLIEALGITSFDPAEEHRGPFRVGGGRLQVRTIRRTAAGAMTKVTDIDESRGWVLAQHLYDERGNRVATALTSQHQRDPLTNVTLPRQIEIQWPSAQMSMKIVVHDLELNTLGENAQHLWVMPEYQGFPPVDLGRQ